MHAQLRSTIDVTVRDVNLFFFSLCLATPAPTITSTVVVPSVAAQSEKVASWIIALIGGIGGLIFLVLVCAIVHCCFLWEINVTYDWSMILLALEPIDEFSSIPKASIQSSQTF